MDLTWLVAIPAAGIGCAIAWYAKPTQNAPHPETHARISDLERHTHQHAPQQAAPAQKPPPHGNDYVAWGHDVKTGKHWRRHKDGTVEHSHDGKW